MDDYDYDSDDGKFFREMIENVENYVELMIEDNEDLNERDSNGNTKLHDAVKYLETPKMIIELAQAGADMNIKNLDGYTPLHLAIIHRTDAEITTALLKHGADVMARSSNESSDEYMPLHLAAEYNENPEIIYILGQYRKSDVKRSDFVNARAKFGHTPMHCAALRNKNPKVFIELKLLGADVNARSDSDSTPLHRAVGCGTPESILYLIALGADGRAENGDGMIPVFCMGENSNLYGDTKAKDALHKVAYPDSD